MSPTAKRIGIFGLKLAVSTAIMVWIFQKVVERDEAHALGERLGALSWPWVLVAVCMQGCAIACSITRWDRLLVGQGIFAPVRHLIGSFFVGRFLGAFTPGGWTGLNGYRIYDIARHTGKTARAATAIGIEMLLGQMAFGAVVIAGSLVGFRFIGLQGVVLVDLFFISLIAAVLLLLSKPGIFAWLASKLPGRVQGRVRTALDAVTAYQGKGRLLATATLLGVGTHTFNNLVFVATARSLGTQLSVGDVFFVSAMQIFATLIPASINGIGLREATAVALYTRVGVPLSEAALISMVGFAVEMAVSSFGGVVLLMRSSSYKPQIRIADSDREARANAELTGGAAALATAEPGSSQTSFVPRMTGLLQAARRGLLAGLTAGVVVGVSEAFVILFSSASLVGVRTMAYAAAAYGIAYGLLGAGLLGALAWWRPSASRAEVGSDRGSRDARRSFASTAAGLVASSALVLGAFRIRRDFFHEELVWKSVKGLGVFLGCAFAALVVYAVFSWLLRRWHPIRSAALVSGGFVAVGCLVPLVRSDPASVSAASSTHTPGTRSVDGKPLPSNAGAPNVLVVVVDTLRADHLPVYGYSRIQTPHLDSLARDSVVFTQAFANASWTRPSFATILTGRFASSHKTMAKSDSLPSEIETLPEALKASGYYTAGFVTNYNVAPFFNFHQGFDEYHYLEPNFVLGADDTAAKLLWVQFAKQKIESLRAMRGRVEPGTAYQDAETVNQHVFHWLGDRAEPPSHRANGANPANAPWFLFVGYMDPHDPYFPHPYDGTGYARAAHSKPALHEAERLEALYNGEIEYWDEQFGKLLAKLKDAGLYDDMMIVVTSDHGEEFGEHGGFWHGTTLYDEQVHVPLLVKLPQSKGGASAHTTIANWVQHTDIMPTVLRLVGVAAPQGVQGVDLFEGTNEVFAEESHEGNVLSSVRTKASGSALKLIRANEGNPRGLLSSELYRMDADPKETQNLALTDAPLLNAQNERLASYQSRAVRGAAERATVDIAKDATTVDRLKALGYVDDSEASQGASTSAPAATSKK